MAKIIPIHNNKENFSEAVKSLSFLSKEDLQSINTLILEKLEQKRNKINMNGTKLASEIIKKLIKEKSNS